MMRTNGRGRENDGREDAHWIESDNTIVGCT